MASIPRRRRNNKHNLSMRSVFNPTTKQFEQIPASRKAFKVQMRNDKKSQTHDFAIIKKLLYGLKIGDVVYISKKGEGYTLNYPALAGHYSVNSKGPVRLTGELLEKARNVNYKGVE